MIQKSVRNTFGEKNECKKKRNEYKLVRNTLLNEINLLNEKDIKHKNGILK